MEFLEPIRLQPEFHSSVTISLGELIQSGSIDWADGTWWEEYAYNADQYRRLTKKIEGRFWDREIAILPPMSWKRQFNNKFAEIMPKYNLLYKMTEEPFDILQVSDTYTKGRNISSDFPQTMLGGNQDYASYGVDNESETIVDGDLIEKFKTFVDNWNDIDVCILDELEPMFSCLLTVNIDGF